MLLVTYFNYSMCQVKLKQDPTKVYLSALHLSRKYLGPNHFLTLKFQSKYD